jgi:hypothetical protein
MTKGISNLFGYVAWIGLVVACSNSIGLASDKANYSGKYSLAVQKSKSGSEVDSALEVIQNDDNIDVTTVEQGKRTTNRCCLTGSEGDYTSPGGVPGKCKAQFKGKYLCARVCRRRQTATKRAADANSH